jgi:hypothetical protein
MVMGLINKLRSVLPTGGGTDQGVHYEYVRCARCGESIRVRVDKRSELTPHYGGQGGHYVRKGVLGSGDNRCFQLIEVELEFTSELELAERRISGGEFIIREEYEAEHAQAENKG